MNVIVTIPEFRDVRANLFGTVGFVPTMGALHRGHMSLVKKSNQLCDFTVVSVFVNPAQFAAGEDLSTYPRTLDSDLKLLSNYNVECVFAPNSETMYDTNFSTFVNENSLSNGLEGLSRPHFFKGVSTIVAKLFNIIQPSHAFFGEKDAQQLRVIQRIVENLNFPIQIIPCPIVREENGLAMSSRNEYLNKEGRSRAGILYSALLETQKQITNGERSVKKIIDRVRKTLHSEPLAKIDYISIVHDKTLIEVQGEVRGDVLVSLAVYFSDIRLIDNITIRFPE